MGRNELNVSVLAGVIAATLAVFAGNTMAAGGYLATVGPAPLRIRPARVKPVPALPALPPAPVAAVEPAPAARPTAQRAELFKPGMFLIPGSPLEAALRNIGSGVYQFTTQPGASPKPVEETVPAEDMLVVTPQMLVDYFKPVRGSTNGSNVSVIVPVTFTPPTPAPLSSSATYRTP